MKRVLGILGIAFLGGVFAIGGYKLIIEKPQVIIEKSVDEPSLQTVRANYTPAIVNTVAEPTDFTKAAEKTVNAVVHVKNTAVKEVYNPFDEFFGGNGKRKQEQVGTGSGVIISSDGYIVTNNHVIEGATDIEITLNSRKKIKAELIGTDKENDIALIKIETDMELPYVTFGNSDNAKIGEWVLAVGNPYNLNSTVTAGIISAKGRDLEGNGNITDSFIQTDAAVNPGNSGGALVNTRGELIGINTAITSRTGSYIGYSFAVPSNITKKIIDDLLEYGNVQEALIGFIPDIENTEEIEGVRIGSIEEGSDALKAGLREGDVIIKVNNVKITKFSDLKGQLKAKRPGEVIDITVNRNEEELVKTIKLSRRTSFVSSNFGIMLKDLTEEEKKKRNLQSGVKIIEAYHPAFKEFKVGKEYVITKINNKKVYSAAEAKVILDNYPIKGNKRVLLHIVSPDGQEQRYGI